jgi:3-deoxy-manno-octulosonate cytidylyltransferase (CMP-KDO synthetase)
MTSSRHESCVDRVAEAAKDIKAEIIINVQGDMPLLHPNILEKLVDPLLQEKELRFTDMMGPIENDDEINNFNVVKVVIDLSGNALYYSREPIPSLKKVSSVGKVVRYKQFGINAFRRESLIVFSKLPRTPLETLESVDMLRLLEKGYKVRMVSSPYPVVGVDTPNDFKKVVGMMRADPIFPNYL